MASTFTYILNNQSLLWHRPYQQQVHRNPKELKIADLKSPTVEKRNNFEEEILQKDARTTETSTET